MLFISTLNTARFTAFFAMLCLCVPARTIAGRDFQIIRFDKMLEVSRCIWSALFVILWDAVHMAGLIQQKQPASIIKERYRLLMEWE